MIADALEIRTPEGIVFRYPLASPIRRLLAVSVDLAVVSLASSIVGTLASLVGLLSASAAIAIATIGIFVISMGYGAWFEWRWRGQTLGKRLLRLRVIDASGLHLQGSQVILRNLLRAADSLPAFYFLGGLFMLFSARLQRLGDLAAGTVVVHHPRVAEPDLELVLAGKYNSLRQQRHLAARLRALTTPEEAAVALQALLRRDHLDPQARLLLYGKLADHFRAKVSFPADAVDGLSDEQYLRNTVDVLFRSRESP